MHWIVFVCLVGVGSWIVGALWVWSLCRIAAKADKQIEEMLADED